MNQDVSAGAVSQPTVHVLLPVHNRREITVAFVRLLARQTYRNYRLVLIDDGSSDGTADAVKRVQPDVVVIRGEGDWWWAGSLQQGYLWLKRQAAPHDVVLIMNDDTSFEPDFIVTGLRVLANHPGAFLTATGYNMKSGASQDSGGYRFHWGTLACAETYDNAEINCASTRGLMVSVADFLDVEGFHAKLIPHYLSDIEFTMRAGSLGKKLMIHPDFRIGINFETTGDRDIGEAWGAAYLRKVFSKRSAMNPLYWSSFIVLRAPWRYKALGLWRIWHAVYRHAIGDRLWGRLRRAKRAMVSRVPEPVRRLKRKLLPARSVREDARER